MENSKQSSSRRGNCGKITFFICFENQEKGCARPRRFAEKIATAKVFLLERQPW
jgi:hypothetical protein